MRDNFVKFRIRDHSRHSNRMMSKLTPFIYNIVLQQGLSPLNRGC